LGRKTSIALLVTALVVAGGIAAATVPSMFITPSAYPFDWRPAILCVSLVGLNVLSYLVWFNRWNVVAHTSLVFSVVAYVIPIFANDALTNLSSPALDLLYKVVTVGFLSAIFGTLIGAVLAGPARPAAAVVDRWEPSTFAGAVVQRRTARLVFLCTIGVLVSFVAMGFVPALTPDPLVAKFFRGEYADAYRPVAPLYRFSTTVLTLLLPLAALHAWRKRTLGAVLLLTGAVGVMFLGLLREPAVSGVLLFIGVLLASSGRHLPTYFALLTGAYFAGAALYSLLAALGFGGFTAAQAAGGGLFAQVAAGAPDLRDQLTFLSSWLTWPEYTHGKTFVGGLVPGNYQWNPSVWSLQIVNPGVNIASISSGGLRLPAPVWGLVSFGWPGVIAVSFFNGLATGYLARRFKHIIPSGSVATATCWLLLYVALLDVVPVFFRLSYLSVIQLAVVVWLLFVGATPPRNRLKIGRPRERLTPQRATR
jgi:hypothetical protein